MKSLLFFTSIIATLLIPHQAKAWGERGHHMICEVATRLVREPNLKKFLETKGDLMGHACNVPDIYWRDLGAVAKEGDEAHFLNPENGGLTPAQVPTSLADYLSSKKGTETNQQKADALGTLWWRADQFFSKAVEGAKLAQTSALPDQSTQQNADLPYNQGVYNFITNMALMGHFVGDASMPFHNSADYDGWNTGHGGVHSFYETNCVAFFDLKLIDEVKTEADAQTEALVSEPIGVVDAIKQVSVASYAEKETVEALDKVLEPSKSSVGQQGIQLKTYAQRDKNEVACPPFRPLITKELARSAVALANLWDQAYIASNRPNLGAYKLYKYPLTPDFVGTDYVRDLGK